jgi:hypothetical protein
MSVFDPLLCRLGRHRPRLPGTWHRGYGFTTCERCGEDLVKSWVSDWTPPKKGYAVVWRTIADAAEELQSPAPSVAGLLADAPTERPAFEQQTSDSAATTSDEAPHVTERSPFDFGDFETPDPSVGEAERDGASATALNAGRPATSGTTLPGPLGAPDLPEVSPTSQHRNLSR